MLSEDAQRNLENIKNRVAWILETVYNETKAKVDFRPFKSLEEYQAHQLETLDHVVIDYLRIRQSGR